MAVVAIEMLREHRFMEDVRGNTRVLHRGWVGELDEESAVVAIATGAARPRVPLTKDQALAVEVVKAAKARDYARIEQLRADNPDLLPPNPSTETASATTNKPDVATDEPAASTSKRKSR